MTQSSILLAAETAKEMQIFETEFLERVRFHILAEAPFFILGDFNQGNSNFKEAIKKLLLPPQL